MMWLHNGVVCSEFVSVAAKVLQETKDKKEVKDLELYLTSIFLFLIIFQITFWCTMGI
jgi:hypothetical protein